MTINWKESVVTLDYFFVTLPQYWQLQSSNCSSHLKYSMHILSIERDSLAVDPSIWFTFLAITKSFFTGSWDCETKLRDREIKERPWRLLVYRLLVYCATFNNNHTHTMILTIHYNGDSYVAARISCGHPLLVILFWSYFDSKVMSALLSLS